MDNKAFYKVTDLEGKIFTLVEVTKTAEGDKVKVAERNSAQERVSFREVESFSSNDYTGKVASITSAEYQEALGDWGYSGQIVDNDPLGVGAEAQGTAGNGESTNTSASGATESQGADTEKGADETAGGTASSGEAGNGSAQSEEKPSSQTQTDQSSAGASSDANPAASSGAGEVGNGSANASTAEAGLQPSTSQGSAVGAEQGEPTKEEAGQAA